MVYKVNGGVDQVEGAGQVNVAKVEFVMPSAQQVKELANLMWKVEIRNIYTDRFMKEEFTAEEWKEFLKMYYRTVANFSIGMVDFLPVGVGDSFSFAADIAKVSARFLKKFSKVLPEYLDLTPDVSLKEAILSEALELPTAGAIPTHLIFEFRKQFAADVPRLLAFYRKALDVQNRRRGIRNS